MIIPAVDIMQGKIVQLVQGKRKVIELAYSKELVERFSNFPEIQVVDIDAAKGNGNNYELVGEICKVVNARVGGGIRSVGNARDLLGQGAKKVIIGTMANKDFLEKLCREIGKEKVIVALDSVGNSIVTDGWEKKTNKNPFDVIRGLEDYCSEFFYTAVEMEGLMQGFDLGIAKRLKSATENRVVVAGGISSEEEVRGLEEIGVDCVVGMAVYAGRIKIGGVKFGKN